MNIDFYASWNGPQVAALFRAVVGMTESSGYTVFLLTMTTLGLLGVTIAAVLRWKPFEMLSWFMSVVLFYSIAFVPKITVTVEDTRAMTAEAVTGVPIGLGLTAALSSKIGHFAANLFETALGDVDASKFTKFGAVFPERAAAALAKAGPVTAETRAVLDPFLNRCVMPEILESPAKLTELMTAENLAATVTARGWTNPARVLMIEGSPVYCDEAAQKLLTLLKTREVPAQEKLLMAKLSGGNTGSAVLEAALKKAIPEAEAKMLGISRTLSESLTHAVLLTEIPGAAECQAGSLSMPLAGAVALAKAQGSLASEISFRTMGELAAAFLPKLRNLLEFILIAAFPIVLGMLVAFGAEGTRVARMYLTLFLWLALWAPIASVINYLLIHLDANPMNRIAEIYGGLTLEAADFIRDQGATSQAMAGYLMLLVPLISYLLARASDMGAANLASSMMQPAAGAAQSQSAQLSAGNVAAGNASIGNSSVNNANANKSDISTGFVAGSVTRTATAQGSVVRDSDRGQVTSVTAASSDLGVTGASTLTQGRSTQQSASDQGSVSSSRTTSYAEGVRTENSDSAGWTVRRSEESSSSRTQNESQTLSQGETASRSIGEHAQSSLSSSSAMTEASGHRREAGRKRLRIRRLPAGRRGGRRASARECVECCKYCKRREFPPLCGIPRHRALRDPGILSPPEGRRSAGLARTLGPRFRSGERFDRGRHHHAHGSGQRRSDGQYPLGRIGNELAHGRIPTVGKDDGRRDALGFLANRSSHGRRNGHPRQKRRAYGFGRGRNPRGPLVDEERWRNLCLDPRHRRKARLLPHASGNRRVRIPGSGA